MEKTYQCLINSSKLNIQTSNLSQENTSLVTIVSIIGALIYANVAQVKKSVSVNVEVRNHQKTMENYHGNS